jgi:guanylate kinase
MRAKFDFNPKSDSGIPCADAGLPFRNGDVLQVLDQEDPSWWQAQHVAGDRKSGIIPGQMFEERRRVSVSLDSDDVVAPFCVTLGKKREKRRMMYNSNKNHEFDRHELVVYEEVAKIQPAQRKVIVLIGAQGVGRRSLKHRMLTTFPDRFGTTTPHTSRPKKREEVDGQLYHYVTREEMEEDIAAHNFIEHGEYDSHLYGTKIDSVRSIMDEDKICVLDASPLALKMLRTAEFKPFVLFVNAPSVAKLRELRRLSGQDADKNKPVSERDISKTVEESKRLEREYSNFFDCVLVNENIDETFEQLMEILDQLNSDPQWVPVGWVY